MLLSQDSQNIYNIFYSATYRALVMLQFSAQKMTSEQIQTSLADSGMSFFDIFAKVVVFLAWPQKFYNQPLLDLIKLLLSQNYFIEKDIDNSDDE